MADRFDACLAEVLRHEGGFVDHPADPGGATNMGITRKTLARWRKVSPWTDLPKSEVQNLSRAEAGAIYRADYWDACHAGDWKLGVDLVVFDYAVNSGPDRAIRGLQSALGVVVDGIVGPVTLEAARKADAVRVINAVCDGRLAFLRSLSNFVTFGRGWTNRVASVRAAALSAAPKFSNPITLPGGVEAMSALSGYKTYIVAAIMLLAGLAQVLGIDLPALDNGSSGSMMLEALAIIFLRKGLKADLSKI